MADGMQFLPKVLAVFGLGILELWAAVPTGFVFGLNPAVTGVAAAAGAILGVAIIVLLGGHVRAWFVRRYDIQGRRGRQGIAQKIWRRYGVIGLGLLAPLITWAPLGAVMGIAVGAPARRLLLWMVLGAVVWSAIQTVLGVLGLAGIKSL